jgi:hypothetical protein
MAKTMDAACSPWRADEREGSLVAFSSPEYPAPGDWVRQEIGRFAAPDVLQWAPGLPKTRSGKIMRRILRKIAENELSSLGDTSTLADPSVVDDLVKNRVD